ncbi:hypothetical protein CALVIDRAFT_391788 [Calocera viscosa TUFC12733]|uniref:F-box domain-containing protein n=1 Tax=Calocera viscosa (strain TUFC12733) TaxID=1330018 RepID=A0A167GFH2_CALVF|nr:hypothetical protein CALVIDRAFT_391788 [Calocera viscosa TUFC12733]
MHHLWNVEDVVRHVLLFTEDPVDQVSLGLTCRSLFEPAMNEVWTNLDGDVNEGLNRFSCLFPDEDQGKRHDRNHIEPGDITTNAKVTSRLKIYMPRIKRLTTGDYYDHDILHSMISKLGSTPLRNLLAGLQTLTITTSQPFFLLSAVSIVPPQVSSIKVSIQLDCEEDTRASQPDGGDGLGGFLVPLLQLERLDHLRVFGEYDGIWTEEGGRQVENFITSVCQAYPKIGGLRLDGFAYGPQTVPALRKLSRLQELYLVLSSGDFTVFLELPALEILKIRALDADSFVGFLENFQCPLLTDLDLQVEPGGSPNAWHQAATMAMAKSFPHLKHLFFHYAGDIDDEYPFEWFDSLLNCHDMARLTVINPRVTPATITDEDLYKIARSWRELQVFDFGLRVHPPIPSSLPIKATLSGLSELGTNCPKLLSISLRASLETNISMKRAIIRASLETSSSVKDYIGPHMSSAVNDIALFDCPPCIAKEAAVAVVAYFPKIRALDVNEHSCQQCSPTDGPLAVDKIERMLASAFGRPRTRSISHAMDRLSSRTRFHI